MRDEQKHEQEKPKRAGLYIKPDTRYALNIFAAQNEMTQDEAIRRLLNLPPRDRRHEQRAVPA